MIEEYKLTENGVFDTILNKELKFIINEKDYRKRIYLPREKKNYSYATLVYCIKNNINLSDLKDKEIHHLDYNKHNDSIENLVLLSKDEHHKIHSIHCEKPFISVNQTDKTINFFRHLKDVRPLHLSMGRVKESLLNKTIYNNCLWVYI